MVQTGGTGHDNPELTPEYIRTNPLKAVVETEEIVDGGFENWLTYPYVDDFEVSNPSGGAIDPTKWTKSTDPFSGSYALGLEAFVDLGGNYLSHTIIGSANGTVNETLQARCYAKKTAGSGSVTWYYAYEFSGTTYYYNFTGASAGTWTEAAGAPNSDQLETNAVTTNYVQYSGTVATLPATNVDDSWVSLLAISSSSGDVVLIDDFEMLVDGVNGNTNYQFVNWTDYASQSAPLTSWTYVPGTDWTGDVLSDTESKIVRATSVQAGSYAVEMFVNASQTGNIQRGYIYQTITGSVSDEVAITVYSKSTDGQIPYMILLDATPGSHTQVWDFVANTWDTLGTTVRDLPGTSNAQALSGTTSYVQTAKTATIPASGNLIIVLMSDDGGGAGGYSYFFDVASGIISAVNQVQLFAFRNESTRTDLDNLDRVIEFTIGAGENPDVALVGRPHATDDAMVMETDYQYITFEGMDVRVDEPTTDKEIATKKYVDDRVGTVLRLSLNIGDWNMDTNNSVSVAHGLDVTKIRNVSASIRNDADTVHYVILGYDGATFEANIQEIDATNIVLNRKTGGDFDSVDFNSTSFNRGWLMIDYVA